MLHRTFSVLFGAALCTIPHVHASELTPAALGQWLCQAVLADRPEGVLPSFPGAQGARVEHRVEPLWRDRPGRMESPKRHVWTLRMFALSVEYVHIERPGRKYGFSIAVRNVDGDRPLVIFSSNAQIERWLAPVGRVSYEGGIVRTPRPDGGMDRDRLVRPNYSAVASPIGRGGFRWRATVWTDVQNVTVSWDDDKAKQAARGFCP